MYCLFKIANDKEQLVLKGTCAKTLKNLLKTAVDCGLASKEEVAAYKEGAPVLTIVKASSYMEAKKYYENQINTKLKKYLSVEIK